MAFIALDALRAAPLRRDPFAYFLATGVLRDGAAWEIARHRASAFAKRLLSGGAEAA